MKVIVAGSRGWTDYDTVRSTLDIVTEGAKNLEVVSGTARGVDQMGERYASERGLPCTRFPAEWRRYGKRAGYLRNEQMADYADTLVAFWDGKSPGTEHMINLARSRNMTITVVYSKGAG